MTSVTETPVQVDPDRIRLAWQGRVSGCQLGKAVEVFSMTKGRKALRRLLEGAGALPLRDYIPYVEGSDLFAESCRGRIDRSVIDDDVNYSVLALMLLERHGLDLTTEDVGRAWLQLLPVGATFTAERAAYRTMLIRGHEDFVQGQPLGFDATECADNDYSDWIGAQIRADLYGWVCPGAPALAADLAERDAAISHRGAGVGGARFVAAVGAARPVTDSMADAIDVGAAQVEDYEDVVAAVELARSLTTSDDPTDELRAAFPRMSPVHTLNNLSVVVWALLRHQDDFSAAIGETVTAGWDTDCNAATVGALWALGGEDVPSHWTDPWQSRIETSLAGVRELALGDLVERTVKVADEIRSASTN